MTLPMYLGICVFCDGLPLIKWFPVKYLGVPLTCTPEMLSNVPTLLTLLLSWFFLHSQGRIVELVGVRLSVFHLLHQLVDRFACPRPECIRNVPNRQPVFGSIRCKGIFPVANSNPFGFWKFYYFLLIGNDVCNLIPIWLDYFVWLEEPSRKLTESFAVGLCLRF